MFQQRHIYLLVGHLDINHHRITGLLDPIGECYAVTKRYVLEKIQKIYDFIERRCFRKTYIPFR